MRRIMNLAVVILFAYVSVCATKHTRRYIVYEMDEGGNCHFLQKRIDELSTEKEKLMSEGHFHLLMSIDSDNESATVLVILDSRYKERVQKLQFGQKLPVLPNCADEKQTEQPND